MYEPSQGCMKRFPVLEFIQYFPISYISAGTLYYPGYFLYFCHL